MLNDIKTLLGTSSFTDAQINFCIKLAVAEVESYCNRAIDSELEFVAEQIAIIKLNRLNTQGLSSQGFNGGSESYIDGYPAEVKAILNRKRKIKTL